MAEIDYQMALLLQHRLEQEHKSSGNDNLSDSLLARQLQEQFEQEEAMDRPSNNLVYKPPPKSQHRSASLTDPSWELVDPTPDIHILFVAFNERFFWNRLFEVCVSWSKRMTSCAGICSYGGKGGLCSITLSEPLLKLRPRKDLVETLLHEMIHAYLFVTNNNKDRDGHGPEFHKHMYRINKESGTNITVYHDFHDEVRLYKQHWWRCNGPCQRWKPYFGMVRRATNRAPGPNDRWWGEHSRSCGGAFIKVQEPEKPDKKRKKPEPKRTSKDIRDFLPTKPSGSLTTTSTPTGCSDDFLAVRDHWATKFPTKRPASGQPKTSPKVPKVSQAVPGDELCECPVCHRRVKVADLNDHLDQCLAEPKDVKRCPICDSEVESSSYDSHLEKCLKTSEPKEEKECPLCNSAVEASSFDIHVEKCLLKVYDGVEQLDTKKNEETVSCLACGRDVVKSDLNSHLDDCMVDIFDDDGKEAATESTSRSQFNCPVCLQLVEESAMKGHIDGCLKAEKDDIFEAFADDF